MRLFRTRLLAALVAAALVFGFGSSVASADPGGSGSETYASSSATSTASADPGASDTGP